MADHLQEEAVVVQANTPIDPYAPLATGGASVCVCASGARFRRKHAQKQWWSILSTQRSQVRQWWQRSGLRVVHTAQ
jgi:hypothetical protein